MARVIVDSSRFEETLERLAERLKHPRPPLEAFARHMRGSVLRNFAEEGRPTPWKPLKVNTLIARYLRRKAGQKIKKTGGQFSPNPNVFKSSKGKISAGKAGGLGDVSAVSTVAGMARSSKTGRVLRGKHGGYNKFAPQGMVFKKPALRAIMQGKILQDSGRLRGSIDWEIQGENKVAIGTNVKYAGVHQFGWPEKNIPARPFLVIQDDDLEEFKRLVTEWIRGEWG